jgi:aminoglycoside 6'-N-acetyltransferase
MGPRVYEFRPLSIADLPLVRRWLAAPEVTQWWGDANKQFELISEDLDHPAMMVRDAFEAR